MSDPKHIDIRRYHRHARQAEDMTACGVAEAALLGDQEALDEVAAWIEGGEDKWYVEEAI
jgi:hypothetical protein